MLADAENDLALKKAELDDAQRTYDWYKDGPNEQDIIAAQAKVDAAKATVNSLSIVAPFTGQVLSINDHRGDSVTTGQLSVNMADLRHLYVETQVDESDIAKVKVGNQAQVTLDALPGVKLSGKVTEINPVGEEVSGLVKFTVRVDLDIVKDQSFLPLGTTANVTIEVKEATATLAVPIAAIQNDAKGEYVLVLKNDGTQTRVDVVTGTIIGNNVVISGDLQEGDVLNTSRESSFKAPNPFGGGK
jgi:HlyD family secretion protein